MRTNTASWTPRPDREGDHSSEVRPRPIAGGVRTAEDGFTLVELVVVLVIMAILSLVAISLHRSARERAGDVTAQANIRIAVPAIEAYRSDEGTYSGMSVSGLQSSYSAGVQGIEIISADDAGYCIWAVAGGRNWYKDGPDGDVTTTACD
jgi:prepilin-type N-terminal cleavage/methylation domain-containing protein